MRTCSWLLIVASAGCGRLGFAPGGSGDASAAGDGALLDGCASCSQGLVAHFKLDESNGVAVTEQIAMHDGTTVGATAWLPGGGVDGGALALQGSGYVRVDWGIEAVVTNAFSAMMWAQLDPSNSPNARYLSSYYWSGANNGSLMMETGSSGLRLDCRAYLGGVWANVPSVDVTPSVWHHLACVYDGAELAIYLDGAKSGAVPATGAFMTTIAVPLAIGASVRPDLTAQNSMVGLVDDVRLYARALTPTELLQLAQPPL